MPPDLDLPQPFDAAAFLPMLKHPPFNRVVDYTDSLLLTGVAYLNGKPMATLMDKLTKKRYVVSEEPNEQGWRLADASVSNELHGTEIKLQVGEEVVTIRYSESQLNPERTGGRALTAVAAAPSGGRNDAQSRGPVRGSSAYLSPADQEYYRKGMSKDARDKFKETMHSHEDKMAKMTDEQRSSYSQKVFNKIKSQEQSGQVQPVAKKVKR